MTDSIDFLGIGAGRSGTTWLSECLREHPDILFPVRSTPEGTEAELMSLKGEKELDFFTRGVRAGTMSQGTTNLHRGLAWYLAQFPPGRPGTVRGEFSPAYLRDPDSAALIHATFPHAKIIAILRNPMDKIYSQFWLEKNSVTQDTTGSFEECIERGDYLASGLYHEHLSRYYALFPPDQVRVCFFDDIATDPLALVQGLYRFLGVRDDVVPVKLNARINPARVTRSHGLRSLLHTAVRCADRLGLRVLMRRLTASKNLNRLYARANMQKSGYPPMNPETRARLAEYFRDDVAKLEALTGRDLSRWR